MPANVVISDATQSDLPAMIALTCDATETDVLTSFIWDRRPLIAAQKHTESLMASLGKRFTHPTNRCYITKATDAKTGELVGWSLVRWENGTWNVQKASSSENPDFVTYYTRAVRSNWIKLTGDKPVVVIGAVYVRPDRQGQGIGKQLVEDLYLKYDLNRELVIVQTRGVSEGFYQKLGWITADSTDIDLSEWGGKGMGYGLHRSPQMLRYPKTTL